MIGHAGGAGWDEILLILVPVVLFAVLLVVFDRKARRPDMERHPSHEATDATGDTRP